MCGRYTLTNPEEIAARFGLEAFSETNIQPRFNVSPSQSIPVIRNHDGTTGLELMQWGFQPAWMKGKGSRPPPINARGETLLERPMFKSAVSKGRCLIPADGFYEWKVIPGQKAKQPMHIRLKSGSLFAFAGIWTWNGEEPTCAIITTAPNDLVATIHDRMPVILTEHGERLWIDPEAPPDEAMSVLSSYPADLMEAFAVSTAVNRAGRDAPEMAEPLQP
jgi:putative SOS response-associated peptidase YedK